MTAKFAKGSTVFVPASQLSDPGNQPFALVKREVRGQIGRRVTVDDVAGGTVSIASQLVHGNDLGFLVMRIGDMASETTLLDPLTKSVAHFMRLLVPEDILRVAYVRTIAEFREHWQRHATGTSHVVLIGHGDRAGIRFVGDGLVTGKDLGAALSAVPFGAPKVFASLSCETGRAGFAKAFSLSAPCRDLIAPFNAIHGAAASQFCQTLMAHHLLEGRRIDTAHSRTRGAIAGGSEFRRWRNGAMA